VIRELAREIVGWDRYQWGAWFRQRYKSHPQLGAPLQEALAERGKAGTRRGRGLTASEAELVAKHLPLVNKLARIKSETIVDVSGRRAFNDDVWTHLEALGLEVLEEEVKKFDRSLGVSFGAFVRQRLNGAMNNYLKRKRIKTLSYSGDKRRDENDDDMIALAAMAAKDGFYKVARQQFVTGKPPKQDRSSTGGYKAASYIDSETAQHKGTSHLIPADERALAKTVEDALARLNPRQRAVYIGRELTDPPTPRAHLARELGIRDETKISRIARQAKARMAKLLAA
jgi:RNA polymerase sigma factor (sigma-70 family)